MTISYAYLHCKPDGMPFYVGKGVRSRYKNFSERNIYHKRIVEKYGQGNILIGRLECSSNENALMLEIGLIKCLKNMGIKLCNLTDGGEGNIGWKCPDSVRKAVAESNKKRVWTDESRSKIGLINKGKKRQEHSKLMKLRGHWAGSNNPFYGAGYQQIGSSNHMARAVMGFKDEQIKKWDTLQEAANFIGVSVQAICQAIKKGYQSKKWKLEYVK